MKTGWRVILIIVLVAIVFGGVCLGAGIMTGADMSRIYTVLDKEYNLTGIYQYITVDLPQALQQAGVIPQTDMTAQPDMAVQTDMVA